MIITIVRKPLVASVCENITLHNTGSLNIDPCRIATPDGKPPYEYKNGAGGVYSHKYQKTNKAKEWNNFSTKEDNLPIVGNSLGRWPANVVISEKDGKVMDKQSGILKSGAMDSIAKGGQHTTYGMMYERRVVNSASVGGASRFFKVVKEND